jgi:hypothetical protein
MTLPKTSLSAVRTFNPLGVNPSTNQSSDKESPRTPVCVPYATTQHNERFLVRIM